MTISYIITPKDANIITSPYADVTEKLLPSITFIADAGDLLPVIEPIVTVVYTFTDLTFAELGEFFLPVGVDKDRLSPTQIQYSGKFTIMSPLFGQGVDESNIFLAYDNTTFAGATFFKNILVNVTISDSVGTTPANESWQWTPPFVVTSLFDVLEYNIDTPRIFSDIFQFENLQPTIDDNWNFELFLPIYDHSQTLIGSFDLDPGFVSPNSFSIEDAIGPYSNLGRFFGTLGPNNDFFYEFRRDTVFYWTKEVEQLLDPSFVKSSLVARLNDIPRGVHIENIYSANNKMFIYYKENRNLVDYFEFIAGDLILKQTITLPIGFVRVENILDGNNSKIFDPAVFSFDGLRDRLFIFAGINESDTVEVYKFDGSLYQLESTINLEFFPYRAVYWMNERTFMYMTHDVDNADDPVITDKFLHKPRLQIYRRVGTTWTILNEIDFFTAETIQNFRQNGLTPFDRIVTPSQGITEAAISSALATFNFGFLVDPETEFENLGTIIDLIITETEDAGFITGAVSLEDFFIIWFDSVQGDLYKDGGVTGNGTNGFEKIKTIDKSYPGHNFNNTVLAFDSTFTLFPDQLSSSIFNYRLGEVSPAFNILSNILVRDRQYWFQTGENQGWVSHYTTFGSDNSIFKFKRINDVFWGSIKRKFVNDLSFNDINELLFNLIYTQPTGFDREFPVYWTLINARDNSFFTGDTFNLRKIIDLAFVTPAGIIAIISEFDTITSQNVQVVAIDPTDVFATITYSLISGALPPGANLDENTGEITGFNVFVTVDTPFTFEIEATNGIKTTIREFIIVIENVNVAPIWSTPVGSLGVFSDQNGIGSPISIFVLATDADGPGPLTYAPQSGLLPGGLSLNTATGEISGVLDNVTSVILFVFTIRASDSESFTDRTFSIVVTDNNEPPLWSTAPGLLGTVLSTDPINFLLVASDGDGPAVISYALTAGSLPTGATLNTSTGLISGPPIPTVGLITFDFVIGASDGLTVVDRFFSIEVTDNASPVWVTSPGLIGTVTENTLSTLSVEAIDTDGPNPIQYSVLTGNFPGEFTLDTFNGNILGTARNVTSDETFNFTLRADDSATIPADRAFSLTITNDLAAPVWITPAGSIGNVHETLPVNLFVQATDADLGIDITYVRISGTLPTGSILNTNTGNIVGSPLAVATDTVFNFVIRATNGSGSTDRSFSITIKENLAPVWVTPPLENVDLGVTILPGTFTLLAVDPDIFPLPIGVTYSLVGGALPLGITLNPNGDIVGTLGAAATANISSGIISSITVTVPGNSYIAPPIVTIFGGEFAEGTAVLAGTTVTSINVDFGGSGYIVPPAVTITGDGINAAATANISGGEVISFTVTNNGTGYTEAEIIVDNPTGGGSGATVVANLTADAVTSITVTNPGSGYTVARVAIEGPEALIGLYPFTARADDGLDFTDENFTFTVKSVNLAPAFLTAIGNIATFTEGEANSIFVVATDPNPDDLILTYDIISGSLPLGLSLNSTTGEISGTVPEGFGQAGDHAFTMRVRDRVGENDVLEDTGSFTITVALAFFVPQNAILAYEGTIASIPANWTLCDGTSGTPDLSDRFIMGTDGVSFTQNQIAGSPSTAIAGVTNTTGDHNPLTDNGSAGGGDPSHMQNPAGAHSHTVTGNVSNVPPSFELAYIMATADNSLLPTGAIVWFDDTIANIPSNYAEKTELRDRQIHGVTNDSRTTIGALSEAISVTTNTVGSHNHIISGAGNNAATSQNIPFANTGAHSHTGSSSVVVKDRPPFLALTVIRVTTDAEPETRIIIAYNDDPINLPGDWLVCDGGSGTPDLRAKIPVGANTTFTLGDTGGSLGAPIITGGSFSTIVPHSHSTGINTRAGAGSHALFNWDSIHTWTSSTSLDLPPYHTLHYIMFNI